MEKFVERTLLYDFYGELLTKRQQQIYESVVLEDYSLSEVAEELNISRQGVHDMRIMAQSTANLWISLPPIKRRCPRLVV